MSGRRLVTGILALLATLAAGCGNERSQVSELAAVSPSAQTITFDYPAAGLSLDLPRNFRVEKAKRPGVFRATFGGSVLAAYAYRRREELPGSQRELEIALKRLRKAAQERSPSLRIAQSRTLEVNGARAVELLGSQTISRARLRTRSLHIFKGRAEYVIELLAPPRDFEKLDARVSEAIDDSLEVTGKVAPAA